MDRSYTPYTFLVMLDGKEGRKKKKNNIEIFAFDFLDCDEKSWDSWAIFDIHVRVAKGFHL